MIYVQLQAFPANNKIYEKFQSGCRTAHSTETALLSVLTDLLLAADSGSPMILVLLDLTAAFDTVVHRILLARLDHHVGIKGTALEFFRSYLADRSFSVQLGDSLSRPPHLRGPSRLYSSSHTLFNLHFTLRG